MLVVCGADGASGPRLPGRALRSHPLREAGARIGSPDPGHSGCLGKPKGQSRQASQLCLPPGQQPAVQKRGLGPWTHLTFAVCGVRRQADVHRPLDGAVEAIRVRAGVAESGAGSEDRAGGLPHSHTWTRSQTPTQEWECRHRRAHEKHAQRRVDTEKSWTCRHADGRRTPTRRRQETGAGGDCLLRPTVVLPQAHPLTAQPGARPQVPDAPALEAQAGARWNPHL